MRIYMRAHAAKELDLLDLDLDLLDFGFEKTNLQIKYHRLVRAKTFFDLRFANFFFAKGKSPGRDIMKKNKLFL